MQTMIGNNLFVFFKSMQSVPFYNIGTLLAAIAQIETSTGLLKQSRYI